jgi:hypothetical protein
MQELKTNIDLMFLPIDMISSWKRASISSSFCSQFLPKETNTDFLKNVISTIINECLEFSVKHGVKKTENYSLTCQHMNNSSIISVKLYLQKQQIILLKNYIKKIKSIKNQTDFEKILFTKEFSELGYSIYSLIKNYNGNITVKASRQKLTIKKTTITIKLNNKDINNDYKN